MRFYFQAENGFTELKYHGQASRLPYYNDGTVYGEYSTPGGEAITQTTGDDYAFGEYVYTAPADILVPFDTNYTIMDEQSSTKITLLCSDAEVIAPGTLVQLVYFKNDDDEWTPTDKDGKPWNYSNWVILQSNAQYFDHLDVYGKRYKHTYDMEEALTCFKDYPVRSSKTFAGGRYTYKEVLDITLRLFLKPRVHDSTFVIKDNPLLDEPNSKLSYTNATVFDVVADIGRILDVTPNVEVKYEVKDEGWKYVYYLEYLPNYGTIGEEVDISYFNLSNADTETSTRDTHAGAVISNVQNLVTDEGTSYPSQNRGLYPGDTNPDANKAIFRMPMPIKDIKEIRVFYKARVTNASNSYGDVSGTPIYIKYWGGSVYAPRNNVKLGDYDFSSPLVIDEGGARGVNLYRAVEALTSTPVIYEKQLYIAEESRRQYLYETAQDESPYTEISQAQANTIFYQRGSNEVDLTALYNSTYIYFGLWTSDPEDDDPLLDDGAFYSYAYFSSDLTASMPTKAKPDSIEIKPYIAVTYSPYISATLIGEGVKDSNTTVFFNQYGQVVSASAFGNAVENYADEMSSSNRIVGKIAEPIGKSFYDLYKELPEVGCTIVDHERNKRYVLSQLSVTRQPQSLDILAQLNERKKGRSQVVQADSSQYIAQIPDSEIQESKTSLHFVLRMSLDPIKQDNFSFSGGNLDATLLKPLVYTSGYTGEMIVQFSPVFEDDEEVPDANKRSFVLFPAKAFTKNSIVHAYRFIDNRTVGTSNKNIVLYTDNKGERKRVALSFYKSTDYASLVANYPYFTTPSDYNIASICSVDLDLHKDGYEQTNISTQITITPIGGLILGSNYLPYTAFGTKDGYEHKIEFYDHLITENDMGTPIDTIEAYATKEDNALLFSLVKTMPTHKAWALKNGDDCVLIGNEPLNSGASFRLYYSLFLYVL